MSDDFSTPNAADATVQQTPAVATPTAPVAVPATTPTGTGAPTSGAPDGYVPSYRLRETREAATREAQNQWAQRDAAYQQELGQLRSQVQALVGMAPQKNPEVQAVRDQFGQLYPGLVKLEERAAQLEALMERSQELEQQNQHYWQSYGRQTMDRLFDKASQSLGAPLTEEGKRALHTSFVGFIQSSPELEKRYEQDPSIVEDFWRSFTSSFIDPVRRSSTANVAARAGQVANLPQDSPSGAPRVGAPPRPADLDERVSLGWAQLQALKGQQ